MRPFLAVVLTIATQSAPQNPSPMTDSTRPHPRVTRYDVPGRRAQLSTGSLFVSAKFKPRDRVPIQVHFHGASWLVEHHVHTHVPQTAVVTVHLGSGSRVYAEAFAAPDRLASLLDEAQRQLAVLTNRQVRWDSVTATSFSAGYGAIRSILQDPASYARVDRIVLADSLHASYAADVTPSRAVDLPVDESLLAPFIRFAADAAAGRKAMRITHSEVFPGTYASTTETADAILRSLGLPRRRVLRDGPIGMQQLSDARRGHLHVAGFAGNSAPDHMDHLYALGDWLRR